MKQKIIYLCLPILLGLIYLLMAIFGTQRAIILPETNATIAYISGILCVLSTPCAIYAMIVKRTWPFYVRILLPFVAAAIVLLDHFLFDRTTFIFTLPMLALAYLFIWPKSKGGAA